MSFIFDHGNWEKLYVKNCSFKTQAEWAAEGYAHMPLGILYSGFGILCMVRNSFNYGNLKRSIKLSQSPKLRDHLSGAQTDSSASPASIHCFWSNYFKNHRSPVVAPVF